MAQLDADYAWRIIRDAATGRLRADRDDEVMLLPVAEGASSRSFDAAARDLLDVLLPVACGGRNVVIGQIGQSLDGRIATASGDAHYVTSFPSRVHLHRLRALVDAVIVGAGTVAADDPKLTVRHVTGAHPARVVIDPRARLAPDHRVFCDGEAPTLHVVAAPERAHKASHVAALSVALVDGAIAPAALLDALAERGLRRILVEGGALTVSRFLAAGVMDRLHVAVAPFLIGSGRASITLTEIDRLCEAHRPRHRTFAMPPDTLFDLDLSTMTEKPKNRLFQTQNPLARNT